MLLREQLFKLLAEIYLDNNTEIKYKGLKWADGGINICLEELLKIATKSRAKTTYKNYNHNGR